MCWLRDLKVGLWVRHDVGLSEALFNMHCTIRDRPWARSIAGSCGTSSNSTRKLKCSYGSRSSKPCTTNGCAMSGTQLSAALFAMRIPNLLEPHTDLRTRLSPC